MDLQERLLNITQNEEVYGQCTPETAATVINNENLLDKPAPYFMYEPAETNPNGSIAVNETYNMLKSGSYDGAGAVLANARLFSLYNPIRAELFDTEQRYKKLIFDNSGFFNQFSNNFMRNWYGMQQAEAIYKMRRAEEDGDISSMQSYKFQAEELQRKMNKYVIPEDGINNTLANFTASWARNAPTLTAIGIGAGAVTLLTGGTGTAAYLATAGSMLSSALIIKNDSFGIEAGDMLTAIETDEKLSQLPLNEKLKIAEDYANIASWLESFSALFGLLRIGGKAVTRGTISLLGQGATRTGMKGVGKVIEKATLTGIKKTIKKSEKEQIIKELLNKGIAEKLKDPKYFSYLGKKTLEYALAASEETGTEVTQQIIQDAFLKAVEDGESPDNINVIDNIYKILGDESESSKYAQLALNVFIAAGILGGAGAGIGAGVRSGYNKIISRSMNNADINELSQDIINLKKNSDVYSKSRKAYNEATTELVNAGSAPETVTFDAFKVLDILDEAEKNGDSAILTKLKQLGISRDNLEKSVSGTGVLKIDFSQFDDVVLDPDDTSLFQKVKGLYSFDETTLNKLELEAAINNLVEKQPELQQAMNDPESIFNIAMRGLDEKQFTPQQKAYFSVLAQLMTNRIATFEGGDGRKFALDILNRMQSDLVKTPEDLFMSTQQDQIAGVLTPVEAGKYIMRLTEAANPTTFMHEFSHLATLEMIDSFNSGKMTPYWQKEMLKIADFVDAKPVEGKLTFTTAQHEKVSEAFTTYLKEGKAPIESLNDLFARMREWFVDVYKRLKMGNVRLNKSIRSAFDSLLVSQEDMDRAIIDKNLRAIGRRSWVKEDDYQKYLSDLSKLNRISTSKHLEAIRKQQRLATEEKNKSKLNDIRKDVSAQINNDPRYQLVNDVRVRKINKDSIPNGYKVNKASVYTSVEGGIPIEQFITDHIDVVSNAADVVELLNNIEDKDELIERTAQEQFNEWLEREYPELADVNADSAATNLELVKVRVKEYMMLMKIPLSQFNQYYNELVKAADAEIETMKLRELTNIERLLDLETRIVTKARVAKSDSELASALWHQAAVDYIIVRAKEIRKEVNKFSKHFDKYRYLPNETRLKRIDAYDFDMITAILKNIGFTNKSSRVKDIPLSTRLTQWIEDRALREFSDAEEIRDYIPSLTQDRGVKFENNTYHDFGIYDTLVRLIEGISESDYVLTEENKNVLREKDISAVVDYQKKKKINPSLMSWWTDKVVMKEQFLKKIFPNRQFLDYVIPFIQGTTLREQRIGRNYELISDALSDYVKNRNKIFAVPLSNGVLNMTYGDMQVAVLNIDNMEKWVNSWNKQKQDNLTTDDFLSIIEYAPQKMLDNAQKIWNVFESQKEEFRDAQYKINGFLMDYVEPRKITLSDGREIQSGYYPSGKMPTQQTDFNSTIMSFKNNGVYTMATSRYAKDRQENNRHSDLDLSLNSLRSWLYHTATVIEIGPHFNKLSKMINSSSMSNQLGENITKSLNDWMTYSIVGDNINKLYATFDKISSVQVLGWEPFRLIVQALGWIPAMSTIGPQWMIPQFLKASAYGNFIPFKLETAAQLSPYMKERYENAVNHILSVSESNQLIRTGKTLGDKLLNSFMWFTVHGDAFSSYIVWNAAHDKAIALGYSNEDAVSMADSAVRTSQGDSTAVSRPKILQGDKRFITKFASYFVAMNSIISSAIIGRDRAELVAITMLAGVLSPILESYVRSAYDWAVGSDDDKKKWRRLKLYTFEDVLFYNMKQNLYTTIGQTTMPIAGLGGYFGNLVATGSAYDKPLPMIDYMQNLLKIPGYSTLALKADTDSDRKRYLTNLEKSFLKSLTVPNKYIRMFTEGD